MTRAEKKTRERLQRFYVLNPNGSRHAQLDLFGNPLEAVVLGYTRKSALHTAKRIYGPQVSVTSARG